MTESNLPQGMGEHIVRRFDDQIFELQSSAVAMGLAVRQQLTAAGDALLRLSGSEAEAVASRDILINRRELELDRLVEFLFASRQPQARDLRLLIGMLRIGIDLERAGDEIRSAAKGVLEERRALGSAGAGPAASRFRDELLAVHGQLTEMAEGILSSLLKFDASLAQKWMPKREAIRAAAREVEAGAAEAMESRTLATREGLAVVRISRAFARIAAHLENVGEAIVFMAEGRDVRQDHLESLEASQRTAKTAGKAG